MKILLLCAKGFETMEFAPFIDVMGWARNDYHHDIWIETCAFTKEVTSTFGITIKVDHLINQVNPSDYDALAIPGGFEEYGFYEDAYSEPFLDCIRNFHKADKPIAAICVAALPLGKSGILKNRTATTYHLNNAYRQKQLSTFGVHVSSELLVIDKNIITSSCPQTAVHVAFELLKMLIGPEKTNEVKQAMGY